MIRALTPIFVVFAVSQPLAAKDVDAIAGKRVVFLGDSISQTELKIPGVRLIDLHTAMRKARDARAEPFSKDRVHPGDDGHLLMARTILAGLGVKVSEETVANIKKDPLYKLVAEKRAMRSAAWMKHIGYTREAKVEPQSLGSVEADAAKIQAKIDALRRGK